MIAYVDTSALAKKVFREEGAELADQVWDAADVVVSSELVYPEARAAAALAHRARRVTDGQLREAVDEIERLYAALDVLAVDREVARLAGRLAEVHSLRAYDAVHLAVSVGIPTRRVVMVTRDRDLARACTANGIGVIPAQQEPIRPGDLVIR
jgi:predicted nucleic acid-binding protein